MSEKEIPLKMLNLSDSMTVFNQKDIRNSSSFPSSGRDQVANASGRTLLTAYLGPTKSQIHDHRRDIQVQPVELVGMYTSRSVDTSSGRNLHANGIAVLKEEPSKSSIWPTEEQPVDSVLKTQHPRIVGSGHTVPSMNSVPLSVVCVGGSTTPDVRVQRRQGKGKSRNNAVIEPKLSISSEVKTLVRPLQTVSQVQDKNLEIKSHRDVEGISSIHGVPPALRGVSNMIAKDKLILQQLSKTTTLDHLQLLASDTSIQTVATGASGVLLQRNEQLDIQIHEQSKGSVGSMDCNMDNNTGNNTNTMAQLLKIGFARAPKLPPPNLTKHTPKFYPQSDKSISVLPKNERVLRRLQQPKRYPSSQSKEQVQYLLPVLRATRPQSALNPAFLSMNVPSLGTRPNSSRQSVESSVARTPIEGHIVTTITDLDMEAMMDEDEDEFTLAKQFRDMEVGSPCSQSHSPIGPDRPPSMGTPVSNSPHMLNTDENKYNAPPVVHPEVLTSKVQDVPSRQVEAEASPMVHLSPESSKSTFQHYPDWLYKITPLAMEVGHAEKTLHSFHPRTKEKQQVHRQWQRGLVTLAYIHCSDSKANASSPAFRDKLIGCVRKMQPLSMMRLAKALMQVTDTVCVDKNVLYSAHSLGLQQFLLGSSIPVHNIQHSNKNTAALQTILDCIECTTQSSRRYVVAPFIPYDVQSKVVSNTKTDTDYDITRNSGQKQHVSRLRQQAVQKYDAQVTKVASKAQPHEQFYALEGILEQSNDNNILEIVEQEKCDIQMQVQSNNVETTPSPLFQEPYSVTTAYNVQCQEQVGQIELVVREVGELQSTISEQKRMVRYKQDALDDENKMVSKLKESLFFLNVNESNSTREICKLSEDIEQQEIELSGVQDIGVVQHAAQGRNAYMYVQTSKNSTTRYAPQPAQWGVGEDVIPQRLDGEVVISTKVKRQQRGRAKQKEYMKILKDSVEEQMHQLEGIAVDNNSIDTSAEASIDSLEVEYLHLQQTSSKRTKIHMKRRTK